MNIWGIVAAITSLMVPIYYAKIIDAITNGGGGDTRTIVAKALGFLGMIIVYEGINTLGWRMFGFSIVPFEARSMKRMFNQCFAYLHKHSYKFFTNNFSGSLVKKVNKLVYSFETFIDVFSYNVVRIVIMLPMIVITIIQQNTRLWVIFAVFVVIYCILQYLFYKRQIPYELKANIQDSKMTGELADTITNNFNLLTFASLPREQKRFDAVVNERKRLTTKKWMRGEWMFFISTILMVAFEVIVMYYAIVLRWQWAVSAGILMLAQAYIMKVFDQLFSVRHILKQLNRAIWESAEMIEILDEPHEIIDHSTATLEVDAGKIEFQDVDFAYVTDNPIFKNLSLRVKPGERIAVVGESGSWKTTLVKLLFRFFDIQWGKILIDGQDIAQVTQNSLRSNISMVPQDPILFHRTLRENIAYGKPDASEEEIIAAAKMARCHDFISKFPEAYDTLVGERGIKLSWGERQRVAIARAILENKRILVLDEATSSLDSESEQLIQDAMDEVMKNKTTIVIAHRLSTIMKMDKIIVMEKWSIVETGSHKELLATDQWIYKKLRTIQSWWFVPSTT